MKSVTGIGVIENAGPNHLRGYLKENIKNFSGVDIAVAFITQAGLDELLLTLRKASKQGPVRLLTGLYQCFTEPKALRILLAQQSDTQGRLSVRLSPIPHFHWKAYFLLGRHQATAIVGSSNLTSEGLGRSGELNTVLHVRRKSTAFQVLHRPFEDEWAAAFPLRVEQINRYDKFRPKTTHAAHSPIPLSKILGLRSSPSGHSSYPSHERQYWRVSTSGYVCKETEAVIGDTTNWDVRGYSWYTSNESRHQKGDRIVMFDLTDGWIVNAEIVDTCRTPKRTPDGQFFTAFQRVAGTPRKRISRKTWSALRRCGHIRNRQDVDTSKKLRELSFMRLWEAIENQ